MRCEASVISLLITFDYVAKTLSNCDGNGSNYALDIANRTDQLEIVHLLETRRRFSDVDALAEARSKEDRFMADQNSTP